MTRFILYKYYSTQKTVYFTTSDTGLITVVFFLIIYFNLFSET